MLICLAEYVLIFVISLSCAAEAVDLRVCFVYSLVLNVLLFWFLMQIRNVNNNNNNNNNNNKDLAISGDRNVIIKEAEKILKYKDLTIEIQRMWNVKTKVIPVIIGATGTISNSFRKSVSNIPGKHEVKELQKTIILGTTHILRKVLMYTLDSTLKLTI